MAAANHDLNMWRRDLFKADLDANYMHRVICSNKQPVGLELFKNDLAERLKTVKESKKAAKQLTSWKKKREEPQSKSYRSPMQHLLFHHRGGHYEDQPGQIKGVKSVK